MKSQPAGPTGEEEESARAGSSRRRSRAQAAEPQLLGAWDRTQVTSWGSRDARGATASPGGETRAPQPGGQGARGAGAAVVGAGSAAVGSAAPGRQGRARRQVPDGRGQRVSGGRRPREGRGRRESPARQGRAPGGLVAGLPGGNRVSLARPPDRDSSPW